jgi:hypothetical protein
MYKLTNSTSILRIEDFAFIPQDPQNPDYKVYLQWLSKGNTPQSANPVSTPTYQELRKAAYPSIPDQLDLLYHGGMDAWKAAITAVKEEFPK